MNPGRQGFYRVNYTSEMFSTLLPALKDRSLCAQDRLGLQSDTFALVRYVHTLIPIFILNITPVFHPLVFSLSLLFLFYFFYIFIIIIFFY